MKHFFLSRSRRERALLLIAAVVLGVIWSSSILTRSGAAFREYRRLSEELEAQHQWLDAFSSTEQEMRDALSGIERKASLKSSELVAQVDSLVRREGFTFRLDLPSSESAPPVVLHTVSLSLDKADLVRFVRFTSSLEENLPLVNFEQLVISADRQNPELLDIRMRLTALEINE